MLVQGLQGGQLLLLLLLLSLSFSLGRRGDGVRCRPSSGGRGGGVGVVIATRGGGGGEVRCPFLRLPPLLEGDLRESLPPCAVDALVHVPGGVVVHAGEVGLLCSVAPSRCRMIAITAIALAAVPRRGDGDLPRPVVVGLLGVGPGDPHCRGCCGAKVATAAAANRRVGGGGEGEESCGSSSSSSSLRGRLLALRPRRGGGPRRREGGDTHVARASVCRGRSWVLTVGFGRWPNINPDADAVLAKHV